MPTRTPNKTKNQNHYKFLKKINQIFKRKITKKLTTFGEIPITMENVEREREGGWVLVLE